MTTVASQEKPWPVIYEQRGNQSVNITYYKKEFQWFA